MSLKQEFEERGWVVIPSEVPPATLKAARKAKGPPQPKGYTYNREGHRWFEAWKTSQAVRDIAHAPAVLAAIRELHGLDEDPLPLQTINFDKGTDQPLHQDGIHFQTWPFMGRMIGAWVALEPMDTLNGSLCFVEGSHRLGFKGWQMLGFQKTPVGAQFSQYHLYEKWAEAVGVRFGGKRPLICNTGDVFLWGLDLLHGGYPIEDRKRTRYSQVTHYLLPDAQRGWAPMFSEPAAGDYYWKSSRWFDREGKRHERSKP